MSAATVYAWGAQLEGGSTPSGYIVTTTTAFTWSIDSFGMVTFTLAPAAAAAQVTWSGNFYFRCHFVEDMLDAEQFMSKLWTLKQVQLRSTKL
jgi:hypothetical protein